MRVFLAWSGGRSKQLAEALCDWIPDLIHHAKPWMSSRDIGAGVIWNEELRQILDEARVGVLCMTAENVTSQWIHYEAGAITNALAKDDKRPPVIPFLLDDVDPSLPLNQFQMVHATKDGARNMAASINTALGGPLGPAQLERSFTRCWGELEDAIGKISPTKEKPKKKTVEEMFSELLQLQKGWDEPGYRRTLICRSKAGRVYGALSRLGIEADGHLPLDETGEFYDLREIAFQYGRPIQVLRDAIAAYAD